MYPHRAHLKGEADAIVVITPLRDQLSVLVIEEEEPSQLRSRRLIRERSERGGLCISQKFHGDRVLGAHGCSVGPQGRT